MDDPFPGESPPAPPAPRRWPRRLGMVAVGVLALIGPWPVDNGTFEGAEYEGRTLDRLAAMPGPTPPGPIRVGMAEVDLVPARPVPLAGFGSQAGRPHAGVDTPCFARALTVATGPRAVTILAADLLLVNAELARLVLDRAGLEADEVYFTASHTHAGPGGWGRHPIERLVAGKFDPDVLATLAERMGNVVLRSRADPIPAEVALVQAYPPGRQKNRVVPGAPTHDALSALIFRPLGATAGAPPLAILAVFGAHATIVRTDPPRLSADYPGALVSGLKARTGAEIVLFAAGAVGDAAPVRPPIPSPARAARALGSMLADDLLAALPSARFSADVAVDRLRLAVDLPPMRLPFSTAWLRFSPAATWWIADQRTHLDALRVGPAVLVGFPGDEAGHLAGRVVADARGSGVTPVVTSFNGDYRGYFESEATFRDRSCYETRWMNFYGPWIGEYLGAVATRMVGHLAGPAESPTPPARRKGGDRFRPAVAAWLLAFFVVGTIRGNHSLVNPGLARVATLAGLGFAVAFIAHPDSIAWARFGLPPWSRWLGIPLASAAFLRPPRDETSAWTCDALAWSSLTLLAACWPVFLAGIVTSAAFRPAWPRERHGHQSK